jgi:hypothetical protein
VSPCTTTSPLDDTLGAVVAAVHYFATEDDQEALLDYLGEPAFVTLHPWPVVRSPLGVLLRSDALVTPQVMVVHSALGPPVVIRQGDRAMEEGTKAGVFNRINWDRLRLASSEGLVDSNASPVLFWQPGKASVTLLSTSSIGSQADALAAVSAEYEKWVKRAMGWVRRKGTRVWGLERHEVRPDLDIDLNFVNNVYALPGALLVLQSGALGRG